MSFISLLHHPCIQHPRTRLVCLSQRVHPRTLPQYRHFKNQATAAAIPQEGDFALLTQPLCSITHNKEQTISLRNQSHRSQIRGRTRIATRAVTLFPNVRSDPVVNGCGVAGADMILLELSTHIYNLLTKSDMSMIYSLVARERLVLVDFTSFSGNFTQISQDVSPFTRRSYKRPTFPRPSDST